jgi:hypothetical protein
VKLLSRGDIFEVSGKTFHKEGHGPTINQKLGTLDKTIIPKLEFTFVNREKTKSEVDSR